MESDLWMKSVVLIIRSERSKATVQGHDARGNEGVGYPQMVKIEVTVTFEE
jgi:hypothetical protein